jgi:hypothetical protein
VRKNHHGKKDRLVKRVFALCLALAVICTCLVPVFATEGLSDLQVEKELPGTSEEEAAGFGDDFPAVDDGEPREVYDDSEAAGFGEEEASRPVEGGEDNLEGGPNVKETEWGTVIDYGTSTSTSTDPSSSTETQWSGEDDVVEKPDDKVVVSGDEIKKLQDMVVYRFWLRELNALDLQDITAQAQINNMTESEYLARNGEVLWNLYFIQAVPRAETIADYSSYIENPSSNRDPKGELRQFDYWYTLDEFGNRVRLNLTDPTSNILDDKTTTVNVYAAWKDGTVGSDEEEDVDHEDLVDKNPVPVDLETKASASYVDEDGNTKSVNLPVEVKNLPSATHRLSVTHMGDNSMTEFCDTYVNELQGMQPLLGLKITPEDINSEKVQLAKGQKATVTVSGLNELPDIAEMEEMGALTADALKVLHQKDDNTVEKLDVVSYENGTLTFETSSFSPFVIALEYPDQGSEDFDDDGIEIVSIEIDGVEYPNVNDGISTISSVLGDENVPAGATIKLRAKNGNNIYYHYWEVMPESTGQATLIYTGTGKNIGKNNTINVYGPAGKEISVRLDKTGKVVIRHTYGKSSEPENNSNHDKKDITVVKSNSTGTYNLYVYTQVPGFADDYYNDKDYHNSVWNGMSISKISGVTAPSEANAGLVYSSTQISDKLGKEIVVDSGQFPVIPILQEGKKTYVDYYYETDPRRPEDAPYYTIEWYRVVVSNGANTGKNGVDGNWGGDETLKNKYTSGNYASPIKPVYGNQYHLDGVLQFHDEVHINVSYKVQDAGKTGFDLQADYSAVYKTEKDKAISLKTARRPDKDSLNGSAWVSTPLYPETKKVGRITYQFDGWYTNEACTGNKFDFEKGTITKDTIFYAKYVPISEETDVTITKQVTGLLGDTNKEFGFSATVTNDGENITSKIDAVGENGSKVNLSSFKLKHNQKITLKDVPVGATVMVTEIAPGAHYKVTATGYTGEQDGGNNVSFTYITVKSADAVETVSEAGTETAMAVMTAVEADDIVVTNHATLKPDTGVLLDTLPYIVILAVVAGGGILLMLRKRRKEDD